jgi:hypothetical protein
MIDTISKNLIRMIFKYRKVGNGYFSIYEKLNGRYSILEVRIACDIIDNANSDISKMNSEEIKTLSMLKNTSCYDIKRIARIMGREPQELNSVYNNTKYDDDLAYFISRLYYAGWDRNNIIKVYKQDIPEKMINYILNYKCKRDDIMDKAPINIYKIDNFRRFGVNVGDKFKLSINRVSDKYEHRDLKVCTVLKKFPYICLTDNGTFPYVDLYVAERVG